MTHLIVACARGWLGTRFHHQGRLKKTDQHKGGVDCLGLLVGVAAELKLSAPDGAALAAYDDTHYSHQPDTKYLQEKLSSLLTPIAVSKISPGDVFLLNIDESPQHLGIVSNMAEGLGLIHAYAQARRVVEHRLDTWWRSRIQMAFRIF